MNDGRKIMRMWQTAAGGVLAASLILCGVESLHAGQSAHPQLIIVKKKDGGRLRTSRIAYDGARGVLETDAAVLQRALIDEIIFGKRRRTRGKERNSEASAAGGPGRRQMRDEKQVARLRRWYAKSAELQRLYPGRNSIILLDEGRYVLQEDGAYSYIYHGRVHLLKDTAVKQYATLAMMEREGRTRSRISNVRVYYPDGTMRDFDPAAVRRVKPQDGKKFFTTGTYVLYKPSGLAPGCILEYTKTVENYNPFRKDFFFPQWGFQSDDPVAVSELTIDLPAGKEFHYSLYNLENLHTPVISDTTGKGRRILRLRMEDVPPLEEEAGAVQYEDRAPYFKGSLFREWKPVVTFLQELHESRSEPSAELRRFTEELVEGCQTEEEIVARIYTYLQQKIRYIAVKMGVASGWGGFDANETWKKRYGCCIDKALLFTAMLKAVGIWSSPVILNTHDQADLKANIPQIGFNHAISLVRLNGKDIFLDCTGYNYRYPYFSSSMDQGVGCIVVFDERVERIPISPPEDNKAEYSYDITVRKDGSAHVVFDASYTGEQEAARRGFYRRLPRDKLPQIAQRIIASEHPAAKLLQFEFRNIHDITKPFTIHLEYLLPRYVKKAGPIRILPIPSLKYEFDSVALPKRKTTLEYLQASVERSKRYSIRLPEGWKVRYLPEPMKYRDEYVSFELTLCRKKDRIRIYADYKRFCDKIPPLDYRDHRRVLCEITKATDGKIFLEDGGEE